MRLTTALALAALPLGAQQPERPRTHAPRPTTAAIDTTDLMTRLYIVADDSMLGREAGRRGGTKVEEYLAREAARLGLEPAGENGTYFQTTASGQFVAAFWQRDNLARYANVAAGVAVALFDAAVPNSAPAFLRTPRDV